jgi:uncharacterized membrane protein YfcA
LIAVGTTLPAILPSALTGSARYAREGLVDWRVVRGAAPVGVAAAIGAALLSHRIPGEGHWLMVLTAVIMAMVAVHMAFPDRPPSRITRWAAHRSRPVASAAVGALAGGLSGLLGVGGGVVMVPGFTEIGLDLKRAIATSLVCVGIFAVPSTITHAWLGDIDWRLALCLAVGVVPGARIGAALAIRASRRNLRLAVAGLLGSLALVYGAGEIRDALGSAL